MVQGTLVRLLPGQKTISLTTLRGIQPRVSSFDELLQSIEEAAREDVP